LWDHPDKHQTCRTIAHNLVVIDGRDQQTKGRGGQFHLFSVTARVKVMEASSNAYGPGSLYRRTCVLMDHGQAGSYVVDIFRAGGGARREYVFHGPGNRFEVEGLPLAPAPSNSSSPGALPLENLREAASQSLWSVRWELQDGYELRVLSPGQPGETVAVGDGWGQRDHRNTDRGAVLPYIVRRRVGENERSVFVAVFAGNPIDKRLVEGVELLPVRGDNSSNAVAASVKTADGADLVLSMLDPQLVSVAFGKTAVTANGRLTAIVSRRGGASRACMVEGCRFETAGVKLDLPAATSRGKILGVGGERGVSYFVADGDLPNDPNLAGRAFFTIRDGFRRAYPIVAIEQAEGRTRVFTKRDGRGFEARPAQTWELPTTVDLEIPN
jgi:hypothetical protein